MLHINRTTNVMRDESDAIRRELNQHNEVQRVRYRARRAAQFAMLALEQGRSHLAVVGVA
ncbi:hypothetical protein DIE21_17155 [Burkholderia sp. Bp9140]|uniref:hypothetical protein n=1 Tax=Burkholderia sp. Bp9140 TaxID=2184572 RepID=UPI000F567173|nr:hypothetical protein [Burkholderia sp. Bp9140]RQR50488.1 hypothetical protein DIE21_17155 [Burkholderia sp. Bp9140]